MKPRRTQKIEWSPELAYAVGLITTDGNLSTDKRHMVLVSKDVQLLKTFKKCLNLKNKIGSRKSGYTGRKNCHHVSFGDVILYQWLTKIGLTPNKTKTIGRLKIPDKYFFDFLRGHLDGDGCYYSYWDKRWKNSFMFYTVFTSSNPLHIEWLRNKIINLLDIKGHTNKTRNLWQLKYAKQESRLLIPKIYYQKGLPCLERKYKKIKDILKISENLNGRVMESVDIYA